jgi:molybdate transport system substrate-binding protein
MTRFEGRRATLRTIAACALAPLAAHGADTAAQADVPLVAAAADLRFALDEIAANFRRATGKDLRIVYGSSGNFRRQIAERAPYELFLSADEAYIFSLAKEGFLTDDGVPYAVGRIALVIPEGSPLKLDAELVDLAAAARDGRVRRFAIANPEHAPYGRAAREALQKVHAWDALQDRLVLGENVAQATQFAVSGSAQGGIVALSLARSPELVGRARFVVIPERLHAPLVQRMALTKRAQATAREFYAYLRGREARVVFDRHGFAAPAAS